MHFTQNIADVLFGVHLNQNESYEMELPISGDNSLLNQFGDLLGYTVYIIFTLWLFYISILLTSFWTVLIHLVIIESYSFICCFCSPILRWLWSYVIYCSDHESFPQLHIGQTLLWIVLLIPLVFCLVSLITVFATWTLLHSFIYSTVYSCWKWFMVIFVPHEYTLR